MKKICLILCLLMGSLFAAEEGTVWIRMGEWSSAGVFQSDLIPLRGEQCRIRYQAAGKYRYAASLIDPKTGKALSIVNLAEGIQHSSGSAYESLPGNMRQGYLRMESVGIRWFAIFEQFVSDVDRWELLQEQKKKMPQFLFGAWCGEGNATREIRMNIPSAHWKITAKSFQAESIWVELYTSDGKCLYRDYLQGDKESVSWGHQSGELLLRVKATGASPWSVTIQMD